MIIALKKAIKNLFLYIALPLVLFGTQPSYAQKKIKLEPGAGKLQGIKKDGVSYNVVVDNVQFTQENTRFYCDSAVYAKKTNYLEAYGRVRIIDGDSLTITAGKLQYDGDTRIAKIRSNVVLTQLGRMQLFTDFLDFDRNTSVATYFNNGKIVDSTNVLTSAKGYYNTQTNMASFKTNVNGKNDDYTMVSDTLVYNTKSGIVYFVAPTELTDVEGDVFLHDGGQYNSREKRSSYVMGRVETEDYFLKGNNLKLDDIRAIYHVEGDVLMIAKDDDIYITGQQAVYYKKTAITKVYDNALMRMVTEKDTLYLRADTLVSIDSKYNHEKRLLAHNNVRVFKSNLQAVADSIAYKVADSTMFFYTNPVLWTSGNQLSADSINMVIRNKAIDVLNLENRAFVITKDSSDNFNQIKGREMVAHFEANALKIVNVYGNGESIFYMYDEKTYELVGMNKIICSDITLKFEDQKLVDAAFLVNPEGDFIPPHELKEKDKTLPDFKWMNDIRPKLSEFRISAPAQDLPAKPPDAETIDLERKESIKPKKGLK